MTALLPPNLLRLFAPRPPLPFLPPVNTAPNHKKPVIFAPLSTTSVEYDDDYVPSETAGEKHARLSREKQDAIKEAQEMIRKEYKAEREGDDSDPYKTLFIANLDYSITESQLQSTFDVFGEIKKISKITKKDGTPKGYAFIEFVSESGMKSAYKEGNGLKLGSRRLLVDVERGRTVKDWKPKKLGGGLGIKRDGTNSRGPSTVPRTNDRPSSSSRPDDRGSSSRASMSRPGLGYSDKPPSRYPESRSGGLSSSRSGPPPSRSYSSRDEHRPREGDRWGSSGYDRDERRGSERDDRRGGERRGSERDDRRGGDDRRRDSYR